jgi:hypothetical protein
LSKQEQDRQLKAQELELQEQRRQMILMQMRREEEMKAETMLERFEEEEQHVEMVKEVRQKEHIISKEKKEIRTQMKLENVDRVRRVTEYQRMGTLKKIEDQDKYAYLCLTKLLFSRTTDGLKLFPCFRRIKDMLNQRKSLVEERKRAAAKTRLQKESIAKVMDEVRTNASMANKIITQALTGKITLESLTSPGKLKGTTGRSKTASDKKLDRSVSADRMGLGRESKSAGQDAEFENHMEDPANRKTYSLPNLPPQNVPAPYKSPYETHTQ